MKKTLVALTVTAVAATTTFAANTAACAGCHGANFEKKAMGQSKIVKDMAKADIVTALKGYKAGGTFGHSPMKAVMQAQAKNLSDADIEAIATQIAGSSKAATSVKAPIAPVVPATPAK